MKYTLNQDETLNAIMHGLAYLGMMPTPEGKEKFHVTLAYVDGQYVSTVEKYVAD